MFPHSSNRNFQLLSQKIWLTFLITRTVKSRLEQIHTEQDVMLHVFSQDGKENKIRTLLSLRTPSWAEGPWWVQVSGVNVGQRGLSKLYSNMWTNSDVLRRAPRTNQTKHMIKGRSSPRGRSLVSTMMWRGNARSILRRQTDTICSVFPPSGLNPLHCTTQLSDILPPRVSSGGSQRVRFTLRPC